MQPTLIPEQARPLVRLVQARRRLTPLERADRWVHDHPGTALSLVVAAAFALAAIVGC